MEYSRLISKELKLKLEKAFEKFKEEIKNPWVITLLKYPKTGEQVYLIAKDPNEDTYYGIIEGEFSLNKDIYAIPESNITCVEFIEVRITPFRAKSYLNEGIFEYQKQEFIGKNSIIEQIQIGSQFWMKKNLNVDYFQNGEILSEVNTVQDWVEAGKSKQPAWCYFENNVKNYSSYGKLYNWFAVTDKRGLSPVGWRISSNDDWATMSKYLGGDQISASKLIYKLSLLKESKSESGFDGMIVGHRTASGHFFGNGEFSSWWTSTEDGENAALSRKLKYGIDYIGEGHSDKGFGYFVRCIKM